MFALGTPTSYILRSGFFVVAQNRGDRTALHLLLDAYPFGYDIAVRVLGADSWCNASLRCNAPITF